LRGPVLRASRQNLWTTFGDVEVDVDVDVVVDGDVDVDAGPLSWAATVRPVEKLPEDRGR